MNKWSYYLILFQSLPETAILISLGLVLIGLKPKLKNVFIIALITSIAAYFIRALPLTPGIHIFIQLPVLIFSTAYFCRLPLKYCVLASFLGIISITIVEISFNTIICQITGITLKQALAEPFTRLLFPLPEFIFLTFLILIFARKKITLFNIQELRNLERVTSYEKQ